MTTEISQADIIEEVLDELRSAHLHLAQVRAALKVKDREYEAIKQAYEEAMRQQEPTE